jgi:hypothetical protein
VQKSIYEYAGLETRDARVKDYQPSFNVITESILPEENTVDLEAADDLRNKIEGRDQLESHQQCRFRSFAFVPSCFDVAVLRFAVFVVARDDQVLVFCPAR